MSLTHPQKTEKANLWFDAPAKGVLQAFAIGLSQSVTALEESFHDLSDEQLRAFPLEGRNNIAWIAMHCIYSLDFFAVFRQRSEGALTLEWDRRWAWSCPRPTPDQDFPSAAEMVDLLERVRSNAISALADTREEDLAVCRNVQTDEKSERSYNRIIHHLNMHIRQIWLLRGLQGITSGWPERFRGRI